MRTKKKVDLERLAAALPDYPFAYLITVDDGYRVHTVTVEPQLRHLPEGARRAPRHCRCRAYRRAHTRKPCPPQRRHPAVASARAGRLLADRRRTRRGYRLQRRNSPIRRRAHPCAAAPRRRPRLPRGGQRLPARLRGVLTSRLDHTKKPGPTREPGLFRTTDFFVLMDLEVHTAHAAGRVARGCGRLLRLVGDDGLGRQEQRRDGRRVLQRRTGHLDRVGNAGLEQVLVLTGRARSGRVPPAGCAPSRRQRRAPARS